MITAQLKTYRKCSDTHLGILRPLDRSAGTTAQTAHSTRADRGRRRDASTRIRAESESRPNRIWILSRPPTRVGLETVPRGNPMARRGDSARRGASPMRAGSLGGIGTIWFVILEQTRIALKIPRLSGENVIRILCKFFKNIFNVNNLNDWSFPVL